ncbi:MAG: aminotransferase class I/II-fold pyridoxal phosphate-dependent enzyme, partial [Nevskiales bacterium]
ATGLPALREAIAQQYAEQEGLHIEPARILITPGASGALQLILGALLDPGDEILLTDPGYPCNRHISLLLGAVSRALPVSADNAYQPTADALADAWQAQTRALLLASPANPTGSLLSDAQLQALYSVVAQHNGHLILDEIYHGLVYERVASSALHQGDDVFVVNSFSKYYGMTGWRVGWLVAPPSHVAALERLAQNLFIAPSTLGQYAALAALRPETRPELERRRAEFQKRRDFLLPALRALGFVIRCEPAGAFYIYADASRFTNDSYRFSLTLLEQAGVVVTPGIDFGEQGARTHLRFAYTTSMPRLEEGVARLADFLAGC